MKSRRRAYHREHVPEFRNRLREARERLGLTAGQLAVELDIDLSSLYCYENGTKEPSLPVFARICDCLDVTADWLLGLSRPSEGNGARHTLSCGVDPIEQVNAGAKL